MKGKIGGILIIASGLAFALTIIYLDLWTPVFQPERMSRALLTREPYIQMPLPGAVVISWKTDVPAAGGVRYEAEGSEEIKVASTGEIGTSHVVTLTGLLPGTAYNYRLLDGDGRVGVPSSFRTPPDAPTDDGFSFAVIGDSGSGKPEQFELAARLDNLNPEFVLHTGDVVYPAGEAENYDAHFFVPYDAVLRRAPLFASIGNHEIMSDPEGDPYLDAFHLPRNNPEQSELYYSFDWGNAHFIALDPVLTPYDPGSAQYKWLEKDLASTSAGWKFVFFHYPLYSSGASASNLDARVILAPLFERYGVDMVFNGHDHNYERSLPVRDYVADGKGVVYVVTGGGGAELYPSGADRWTALSVSAYHLLHVEVGEDAVTVRALRGDGEALDEFAVARAPTPTVAVPSQPITATGAYSVELDVYPNGAVDCADLDAVMSTLGAEGGYDTDGDGKTTGRDLRRLKAHLGERCEMRGPAEARIAAETNPVPVAQVTGRVTITWNTGSEEPGQVYLLQDGMEDRLFGEGAEGSKDWPFVADGQVLEFKLYGGGDRVRLLAAVKVIGEARR